MENIQQPAPRASSKIGWIIGGIVLLAIAAAVVFSMNRPSTSNANNSNQTVNTSNVSAGTNSAANANTSLPTQNVNRASNANVARNTNANTSSNTNASTNANTSSSTNTASNANAGTTNANANTNSSTAKTAQVSVTSEGFSPSVLTVASGTTVTFTNDDDAPHQPASNPHPTHTDLPGFDALRGLLTGQSYSFTFTKLGTFGYHDHLNTFLTGTIIVQ